MVESGTLKAGVCMHISSLPGPRGIGEIGSSALEFVDWLAESGLSVWQFLPTGPTGFGNSPYQPLSVFAGNPLFVDLEGLCELNLLTRSELDAYPEFAPERVEYARLAPLKLEYLGRAARRFRSTAGAELRAEHEAFQARHEGSWLHDFALFSVIRNRHGHARWTDWSRPLALRDPDAIAAIERQYRAEIDAVKTIQFLFHVQWGALHHYARQRRVALFGDVPIYMALDCAEAWGRPDLLELDKEGKPTSLAGVPPDYFSAEGQNWGCPLYRWERHEAEGFSWWLSRLEHAFELSDMVRLDHFRGFEAYWAIPADASSAREGEWRPGPSRKLFDTIIAALGRVPLVAEDLGLITDEVRALRRTYHWPGMEVLQFLVDRDDFDIGKLPEDCACYTGTHDNDTTVGWFRGSDGMIGGAELDAMQKTILANTSGHPDTIHRDLIRLAFDSRAELAIAPMQDFLGLDSSARMNTPGRTADNWQWRLRTGQLHADGLAYVGRLVSDSGRGPG